MKKRRAIAAVLAAIFSFGSASMALAAEEFARVVDTAEDAEALEGEYIPVLMYHHFAIRNMGVGNGVVTTTKELESQLRYFQSQGYTMISLEKLDSLLATAEKRKHGNGLGPGKKYLCITMDDGYYSNYDLAYPLFKKYRVPASVFAVTDYVTNQIGIQKFTWRQAAEMEKSGYVKVYSHTADHQPVVAGEEESFLASMQRSEETLNASLGRKRVKAMAYPNGQYTEESQRLLEEDGYVLQFTVENGVITGNTKRNAIPRIMVTSGMSGADVVRKIEITAERQFAAEGEDSEA